MKKKRFQGMKTVTVFMFIITLLLWILLLLLKWFIWGLSVEELYNDLVSNMLGILPPIIIFNFVYEYLTKKYVADEMAEEITKTLMSNPEAIAGFDNETKKRFVNTTVQTIVGETYSDMVYTLLDPYLTYQYDMRRFFKYTINLRDYKNHSVFDSSRYMKVYENLKYKKCYHSEATLPAEICVGFFTKNTDLDTALRKETYIFRENLSWHQQDIEWFVSLTPEQQHDFVVKEMQLKVYIDNEQCAVRTVMVDEHGIRVVFLSGHAGNPEHSHSIEISFAMPQKKGHSEIQVCLSEPTYSPVIQLSYPEDTMRVEAFSFMNDGDDSSVEAAIRCVGGYEFCVQDKWIYPMSGVVFIIDDI